MRGAAVFRGRRCVRVRRAPRPALLGHPMCRQTRSCGSVRAGTCACSRHSRAGAPAAPRLGVCPCLPTRSGVRRWPGSRVSRTCSRAEDGCRGASLRRWPSGRLWPRARPSPADRGGPRDACLPARLRRLFPRRAFSCSPHRLGGQRWLIQVQVAIFSLCGSLFCVPFKNCYLEKHSVFFFNFSRNIYCLIFHVLI